MKESGQQYSLDFFTEDLLVSFIRESLHFLACLRLPPDLRLLKRGYFQILHSPPSFRASKRLSLLSVPACHLQFSEQVFIRCQFCVRLSAKFWDHRGIEGIISVLLEFSLLVDKHPQTDGHITMTVQRQWHSSEHGLSGKGKGQVASNYKPILFQFHAQLFDATVSRQNLQSVPHIPH